MADLFTQPMNFAVGTGVNAARTPFARLRDIYPRPVFRDQQNPPGNPPTEGQLYPRPDSVVTQ